MGGRIDDAHKLWAVRRVSTACWASAELAPSSLNSYGFAIVEPSSREEILNHVYSLWQEDYEEALHEFREWPGEWRDIAVTPGK